MISVIYKISSKKRKRIYIGSAKNYSRRKSQHIHYLSNGKHQNKFLQRHFNKYGIEDLEFTVVEKIDDLSKLIEREQYWIDALKPDFNITKTAYSRIGLKCTESAKKRMREAQRNRPPVSQETRQKLSKISKERVRTEEWKKRISDSTKGKKKNLTEENREKIRERNRKRFQNPEERRKVGERIKNYYRNLKLEKQTIENR